jgi:HKD family nuclease
MHTLVPSSETPDGLTALERLVTDAISISVAAAFVTESGAELLAQLLSSRSEVELEVCARGAPITEQTALLRLRDELGATVRVVMGEHAAGFHPKLWLVRSAATLSALSGSGNLTHGGLVSNTEQYELIEHQLGSPEAEENEHRFMSLTSAGRPLKEVENSPAWYEWADQLKKREQIARQLRELDERLASRKSGSREHDKQLLCEDLYELYERTVAARLPGRDGRPYRPSRFKMGLDEACATNNPVPFVARTCRHQTEGFDVIRAAGAWELTAEALVVNTDKPYHDLFYTSTVQLSTQRLRQFDE